MSLTFYRVEVGLLVSHVFSKKLKNVLSKNVSVSSLDFDEIQRYCDEITQRL